MTNKAQVDIREDAERVSRGNGRSITKYDPEPKELIELTPELASYIIREIGKGRSLVSICQPDDMPHMVTFLKHCQANPELAERYQSAKKLRAHNRAEEVEDLTVGLDPMTTTKQEAYVTDIKARNLLRLAEIGDPASFSPKMQMMHQHSGNLVNITLDLSAPQSRQITDIEASQVLETPTLAAPQSGEGKEKGEGGGGQTG